VYTLADGLGLVANTSASGTTGLYAVTGQVVNGQVQLFVTNYTIGDLDPTFVYGITDSLTATSRPGGETFSQLVQAPVDSNFKGLALAPTEVPEPATLGLIGLGVAAFTLRRKIKA
jgi:hypothetical protein